MITQIFDAKYVLFSDNYYGKKIQSLVNAYGINYNFSRLYKYDSGYFHIYNSSMVIDSTSNNIEELCEYINMTKPVSVEVSSNIALQLDDNYISKDRTLFMGITHDNNISSEDIYTNSKLDNVYDILRESFGLTEHDIWYADISHKIRHGVSNTYLYANTTVTMQFDIDGFVFVSHIATSANDRGKGIARNLLYYLCNRYNNEKKEMYLFALDERKGFYKSIGFEPCDWDNIYELKF